MKWLSLLFLLAATPAHSALGVMEDVWTSSHNVRISSATQKLYVGNGGICFPGGLPCQTSPGASGTVVTGVCTLVGNALLQASSSQTFSAATSTGPATNHQTINGTTVAFTMGGANKVMVVFTGVGSDDTNQHGVSFRIDNAYIDGLTATTDVAMANASGETRDNLSYSYVSTNTVAAGSHNAVATFRSGSGSGGKFNMDQKAKTSFAIYECGSIAAITGATGATGATGPSGILTNTWGPGFSTGTITVSVDMTGASTLTVHGSSFSVGGSTFVISYSSVGIGRQPTGAARLEVTGSVQIGSGTAQSTFTAVGALAMAWGSAINASGPSGNVIGQASGTFSGVFGNGAALTSLTGANVTGIVPTATALAATPGNCSAGEFYTGLTADGTRSCAAPSGSGDVVKASTQALTGTNQFTVQATTGVGTITISTPTANALYSDSLPKAWATFNGTGTVLLQASFNVNYVTDGGAGDWTIHFAVPFKTVNYACVCSMESSIAFGTDAEKCGFVQGGRTVSQIRIRDVNSTDAASSRDPDRVNIICFGQQ